MSLTYFIAYHLIFLAIFTRAIVVTGKTVSQLRNTGLAYNGRLPFAYYSLGAWMFWALQYVVLIGWTLFPSEDPAFLRAAVSIGFVVNVLWAIAILSLYSKLVNQLSLTLTYVSVFSILMGFALLIALISSVKNREILGSTQFTLFEVGLCIALFGAFALSINQLRLNKSFAVTFLIHGVSQGLWQWLFSSSSTIRFTLLIVFPVWHIAVLLAWRRLTPQLLQTAQSDTKETRFDRRLKVEMLTPFRVMVSSTVEDLKPERDAADRAIRGLHLDGFLAEKYGSFPNAPSDICEYMSRHCDIFILIIGQRYGYVPEPGPKSVVQLEYEAAREDNPEKILSYVKKGVLREDKLEEFLKEVENFKSGYLRSEFTSPKQLREQIKIDIMRWLTSRAKPRQQAG